jgi:hypothetical protein
MLPLRFSLVVPACAIIGALACIGPPLAAQTGSADLSYLGVIDRVQGHVARVNETELVPVKSGDLVSGGDRFRTSSDARLLILFNDGTRLTLGESAEAFVADFVYNPIKRSGAAILDIIKGAFRFTSGEMARLSDKRIRLRTGAATASTLSAGTFDLWGGPIDDSYGLLLISGDVVEVRNHAGMVVLDKKRLGSTVPAQEVAPDQPVRWDKDKVGRAIEAVAFK